jgi:hypothetical protein
MELAMMTQPEACKNQKSGDKNKKLRDEIENHAGEHDLSLGYGRFGWTDAQYEEGHCDCKDAIDHRFQTGFGYMEFRAFGQSAHTQSLGYPDSQISISP